MNAQVNIRTREGEIPAWKEKAGRAGVNAWLRKLANEASGFPHVEVSRGRPKRSTVKEDIDGE